MWINGWMDDIDIDLICDIDGQASMEVRTQRWERQCSALSDLPAFEQAHLMLVSRCGPWSERIVMRHSAVVQVSPCGKFMFGLAEILEQ